VIRIEPGQDTPAPWVNVIANPGFGTVVSESGGAYSWSENAHEFRLTPWYNDPVSDVSGEAFYLRDEESGEFWSPTPQPARGRRPYLCRHGFGYSVFEYTENGISSELWIYVADRRADQVRGPQSAEHVGTIAEDSRQPPIANGCSEKCEPKD
jgi:cyclic beta-1,2-glucan synthetase